MIHNKAILAIGLGLATGTLSMTPSGVGSKGAPTSKESKNMRLIAHHDLNGHGDGGEGLAIQQRPDGRRILYLAHEGTQFCVSVLDVTDPRSPVLLNQLPSPAPGVSRCNSLGLAGNVLAIANQVTGVGLPIAGMWLLDVSDIGRVQKAQSLQDLALSFFDTQGAHSRGVHWLWFVDGEFAHISTGTADSSPTHPSDDQFYMIVDVRDSKNPREVGRWWLPGTQMGDACLPDCLPQRHPIDDGYRAHNIEVFPDRPGRAYIGYIDGGMIILDISGLAEVKSGRASRFSPTLVSRLKFSPPFPAWTHTVQPLSRRDDPERDLAFVSDEAVMNECGDAPKLIWLVDIRAETNPVIVGTAPQPENAGELCSKGGRFGAHNQHPNFPSPTSAQLRNTMVGSFFNGGVRIYRLFDVPVPGAPPRIEEIGFIVPPAPAHQALNAEDPQFGTCGPMPHQSLQPNGPITTIQINHMLVDENRLIYANDRITGGLYIFEYTGQHPLD